jgi:3-hydroxybutyryl-CoA dehydratase
MTQYFFEDLELGMEASMSRRVEESDIAQFAHLSGDFNPIHLSEEFARATRFGGRIAHGMMTASMISAVLSMKLPGSGTVYLSQMLNFRRPVRIGDVAVASVRITGLKAEGRRCTLDCAVRVGDQIVLDGEALVSLPARPKPAD